MKKIENLFNVIVIALIVATLGVFAAACGDTQKPATTVEPPVKVSDGISFELVAGKSKNITVADYITANDNAVSAQSSDPAKATATVEGGVLTVTAAVGAEGEATVTLTCKDVRVSFGVNVYIEYTVTLDGKNTAVRKGGSYTLPAATAPADANMEFDYYLVGDEHKAAGDTVTVDSDITITTVTKRKSPIKIKDSGSINAVVGTDQTVAVSEYITTYGNAVVAESKAQGTATVAVNGDTLTVTPVAEGTTTVTLTCGSVEITFAVTVSPAPSAEYTVTVDGIEVDVKKAGEQYTLPAAPTVADADYEFIGWNVGGTTKQPGETVTVESDLTVTSVLERKAAEKVKDGEPIVMTVGDAPLTFELSSYIVTHGRDATVSSKNDAVAGAALARGVVTVTAVAAGETKVVLSCGEITVECAVTVNAKDERAPQFENGSIAYDMFEQASGAYEFNVTVPSGMTFGYEYELAAADANASISGNTLTYTATAAVSKTLTVKVKATDTNDPSNIKNVTFNVTINVTDTTPVVKNSEVTAADAVDLYNGAHKIDLAANIENANRIASYTVNDVAVDGTQYTVTGTYNDAPQEIVLIVRAIVSEGRVLTYTYKLQVMDSTAYRMPNGGFENGLTGWSGATGTIETDDKYWEVYDRNNDGKYYVGVEKERETLISPEFIVGNSGWITFKLGSMRPYDAEGARNIYVFVMEKKAEEDEAIAQVSNVLFKDPERALRLNDYKLDLSAYKGKTVYLTVVDEEGDETHTGDFRAISIDAVNTWWNGDPGANYTDLSGLYVLDTEVEIDLKTSNTAMVEPIVYSMGVNGAGEGLVTCEIQGPEGGLTAGEDDEVFELTATKCGDYTALYKLNGHAIFTANVKVRNTLELPEIANIDKSYEYEEWFDGSAALQISVVLPEPQEGSELSYAFEVKSVTGGAAADAYAIEGGMLKYTPQGAGTVVFTVETTVTYTRYTPGLELDGKVTFTVAVNFKDNTIALKGESAIVRDHDVNDLADKTKLVVDFADYINVPSNKTATYSATLDGAEITLDGSRYAIEFAGAGLGETAKTYAFAAVATEGETVLNYTVTVNLSDTSIYRIVNGSFDEAIGEGNWIMSGDIGCISDATVFWDDANNNPGGTSFNADGKFFFGGDKEGGTGTLTSSAFKVSGSGWITYKLGGARNFNNVYIAVVGADGNELVRFGNTEWQPAYPTKGWEMYAYKAKLTDLGIATGTEVKLRVVDNAPGDYGMFNIDSVNTYYTAEPTGAYTLAQNVMYKLYNNSFESGDLSGWTMSGDIGFVSSANGYWGDPGNNVPETLYKKEGTFFFEGFEDKVTEGEGRKIGTLSSSKFVLGGSGYITFLMGAASHFDEQFIEVVDASDNTVLGRYSNIAYADTGNAGANGDPEKVSALTLNKYKADLHEYVGRTVFIRIADNHVGGAIGMIMFDNAVTYYADASAIGGEYVLAVNKIVA